MFNNNSKKKKSGNSPSMPAINIISEGTTIEGTIETEDDIRIAGIVDGHVKTKGKFMLTGNGHIQGNIKAKSADISGLVDGELEIKEQLILRKSSVIKGDLTTKSLLVEQGAQFDGVCKMNGAQNENSSNKKIVGKRTSIEQFNREDSNQSKSKKVS